MGTGCNKNSPLDNCTDPVSDRCVKYTGVPIPALGICTGDTLNEITSVILEKVIGYASGEDIELQNITGNCEFVTLTLANKDKKLSTFIQQLFDNQCTLKAYIDAVDNKQEPPFPYDLKCLTITGTINRDRVIQAVIDKTCQNSTDITNIINQLGAISNPEDPDEPINPQDLIDNITQTVLTTVLGNIGSCQGGITRSGSGLQQTLVFNAFCPTGTLLFGVYPLSSFDNTGVGLPEKGMCGWYLANGNNGTTDMRGFTASGATNIQGPALLTQVQDGGDTDLVTSIGARKGVYKVKLTASQLASHTHIAEVNDTGHNHTVETVYTVGYGQSGNSGTNTVTRENRNTETTNVQKTGITVTIKNSPTSSWGQAHENRPPTFYGVWIQRGGVSVTPVIPAPPVPPGGTGIIGGGGGFI